MTKKATETSSAAKTDKKGPVSKAASSKTKKPAAGKKHDNTAEKKEEKINKYKEEATEWQDKYIRLSAEFDNYRKRTLREKTDLIKMANEALLIDILSVVDDFERGIATIDKSDDLKALKDGIHLIYDKFNAFLRQKGIKEIEAMEKEFDLDYHEAMTKIPAPEEYLKGKVVDVLEKGYTLNDKVIRYAKVVVGE